MSGRRFFYFHDDDPQTVKARASAASRGGKRARSKDGLASWTVRPITTMEDLKTRRAACSTPDERRDHHRGLSPGVRCHARRDRGATWRGSKR